MTTNSNTFVTAWSCQKKSAGQLQLPQIVTKLVDTLKAATTLSHLWPQL